jgi:cellulose synthase/poly-beta-1,6-N-acetylglucosamine synthase-like glycosyltransferase
MVNSVIITAYKEPKTIVKATSVILNQISKTDEILVVAPDTETLNAVKSNFKDKRIKLIRDEAKGKPSAMNLAVKNSKGDILIWTDGDISISENAITKLLVPFKDNKIGAVSGRPVSTDSKKTKLGFWAYMLSNIAHKQRLESEKNKKRIFCSGYLFAIRKNLMPELPEQLLSEDGYISHLVYKKGYRIVYSPESLAFISYPKNFNDWIKQKKRSVGGYNQNYKLLNVKIRSFSGESKNFWQLFRFVSKFKEFIWLTELLMARVYLWAIIFWDINVKQKKREELWVRVESTK